MKRPLPRLLLPVAAFTLASTAFATLSPATAAQLRANYKAYYLGLPVATATLTIDLKQDRYEARLAGDVSGAASVMSAFSFEMQSLGKYQNGQLQPERYVYSSRAAKETRRQEVNFKASNVSAIAVEPPIKDLSERVPISTEHGQNVIDPLSAMVTAMTSGNPKPATTCGDALRVHGGSLRADVSTAFLRTQATRTPGYRGQASLCSVRYNPVAGHLANASYVKSIRENEQIRISSVAAGNGPFELLVSAVVPLQLGTARIELIEARIDGEVVNLAR